MLISDGFRRAVEAVLSRTTAWHDWTPTVTQGGAVATTITYARYCLVGKICHVEARITATGAGTGANVIVVGGQPTAMQPKQASADMIGQMMVLDSGTAFYVGALLAETATTWDGMIDGGAGRIGGTPNFALANGDTIYLIATYEVT